ncbi:MAG: hypothetical protein CL842_11750 [Crocinitomicaceae bacterium]|nr:hypothetical protein [Crocinitomicaceae bacterium]|tara:strand:- start:9433 stop:9651 length:219 start_codon:yes stop_codon:yes gene_type:complete
MKTLALTLTGIVLGLTTLFGQAQLNETTLNAQIINEDGAAIEDHKGLVDSSVVPTVKKRLEMEDTFTAIFAQ